MFIKILLLFMGTTIFTVNSSRDWVSQAKIKNYNEYYTKLIQETMQTIERKGWSQISVQDINQNINLTMYDWHVEGTVTYTNSFLVAIQKIDIDQDIVHMFSTNSNNVTTAWLRGGLHWRAVDIGFDVQVNLKDEEPQFYTGVYQYTVIDFDCTINFIIKPDHTKEVTTAIGNFGLSSNIFDRMKYMPSNRVTEVLARNWQPSDIYSSVGRWGIDIIAPAMLEVATKKIDYPEICFSC